MIEAVVAFCALWCRRAGSRLDTVKIDLALRKHGLQGAPLIPTFTLRKELETLYDLAKACPPEALILEVGSYLGASTCFLGAGLRGLNPTLVCVDTWQNQTMPEGERDTFAAFNRNTQSIERRLRIVRAATGEVTRELLGGPFDLIFLDAAHSYDETKADFRLIAPLLKPTGLMVMHDVTFFKGVSRVVGEALASGEWQCVGFIHNLCWLKRAEFAHST